MIRESNKAHVKGRSPGSPGLVVMGGYSCSKGRGFESRHCKLDGHNIFLHIVVVRIVIVRRK